MYTKGTSIMWHQHLSEKIGSCWCTCEDCNWYHQGFTTLPHVHPANDNCTCCMLYTKMAAHACLEYEIKMKTLFCNGQAKLW